MAKEQISHMKAMYEAQDPAEHAKKHKEWKSKKAHTRKEINKLVAESVKKSMKEIFDAHSETLKKCNCKDTDSDSDLEPEQYHMEDAGLDLKEVNVSENFALSDLRGRPQKCQKTNQLTPVNVALINTWLGKSKFKKIRILLDSGSSGSIILEKFVRKLRMKNDATTSWIMKGGNFQTSKKCKTTSILKEFFENKSIEWNLHEDSTPSLHQYDMILGHNVLSELRIMLNFKDQTMTWDDSTISMKDPESLADLLDPINDFFWSNDHYKTEALQEASAHLQKILDAKYALADLNAVIQACRHLSDDEKNQLHALLKKNEHLFDGTLGTWNNKPYNIELKKGAKPYHSWPFPVPKVHERTLKVKLDRLVKLGVLKQINNSEWAAPTFIIFEKGCNSEVHFGLS